MEAKKENRVVFLAGEKIDLCPIGKEALGKLLVWMNDQEVTQYLRKYLPTYEKEEAQWLDNLSARGGSDLVLGIETKEGVLIGTIGLHGINQTSRVVTLGISIGDKNYWSKGIGTEAINILLRYAFNNLNMRKVCLSVFCFNERAQACYKKCGFKEEGRKVEQYYRNGHYWDEILMAVFKKDWLNKQ